MEQVCRACRDNTVTLVEIFGNRWGKENEPSLAEMLSELIACEVQQNDPLPQQMCLTCVVAGQNAFRFKRQCEQSYNHFMKMLSNAEQSTTNEYMVDDILPEEQEEINTAADLFTLEESQFIDASAHIKQEDSFEAENDELIISDDIDLENPLKPSITNECDKSESPTIENNEIKEDSSDYTLNEDDDSEEDEKPRFRAYKRVTSKFSKSFKYKTYNCPHCDWSLKDKWKLQRHILSHTDERPFQCPHCDKAYKDNGILQRHIITHPGDFQCPKCPKTFACAEGQAVHMRTNFNTDKCKFKCAECDMTFDHNRGLQKHAKTHKNRFKCPYCTKRFPSPESKTIHIATHTTAQKRQYKFSCALCPRKFKKMDYLKKHVLIHNMED